MSYITIKIVENGTEIKGMLLMLHSYELTLIRLVV